MAIYAQTRNWAAGGHHGSFGFEGHHLVGAIIAAVLFAAVVATAVVLIVYVVRQNRSGHPAVPTGAAGGMYESPLDILKMRYARGEIDKADFEDRKKDLT